MLTPLTLIIVLINIQSKLLQQDQKGLFSQCKLFIFVKTRVNIFTSFSNVRRSGIPPDRHQRPVLSHPGREDLLVAERTCVSHHPTTYTLLAFQG